MTASIDEKAVFNIARRIDARDARADYLQQVCGPNLDALRRIEQLLQVHAQEQSFLESPAIEAHPTLERAPSERPGTQIGPYKLLEQIGEGGMGTVWMAQQSEPVKRLVAVKLIKAGMDSRQVIARFEAERQALALMDHTNIARVLDAGTTVAGRPYFVMDLVRGVPITRYCDEHHLTPRQRLELFIPVCQAVQHAHQKGIIHRDIKPTNVLVALYDGRPVPKVIDFGVAKATGQSLTEKTLVTGFGNIVGTLEYMSPEQAETNQLDIDTRSDIYSLGVLLYELLTGSTPFSRKDLQQAGMLEMLRVIREEEPSKPSTKLSTADGLPTLAANRGTEPARLTRLVRGELDWIVMKALEKDRSRRYETANGFAADVQRHLNDEQVQACPPSAGYRLRKFVRRNKGPVLAATLIVVALVAGIIGTSLGLVEAQAQRSVADTNFRKAKQAAQENSNLAQKNETLAVEKAREAVKAIDAKNDAEAARRKVEITLTDMHTSRGLLAADRKDSAEAVLWFANAARLARSDAEREWANLVRVRSWSREVVAPIRALTHDGQQLKLMEFRPSGEHLLTLTASGRYYVWDWRREESLSWAKGENSVSAACWSPDGKWLGLGLPSGKVEIREVPGGAVLHEFDHREPVTALAFSQDGHWLAVAGFVLRLWDCQKNALAAGKWKHPQPVHSLVFNPRGDQLATACRDRHARVFAVTPELTSLEPLFPAVAHKPGEDYNVHASTPPAFIDAGRGLVTITGLAELSWWDAQTGKPAGLGKIKTKMRAGLPGVVASPDGQSFVFGSWWHLSSDGTQVWNVAQRDPAGTLLAHPHMLNAHAYSPDSKVLLTVSWNRKAYLWSMPDGKPLGYPIAHQGSVFNAAFHPDARFFATGERNGVVRVWRRPDENTPKPALPLGIAHLRLRTSRDGLRVIPGRFLTQWNSLGVIPRLQVYEVASGQSIGPEQRIAGRCLDAALSSDGRLAAAVESQKVATEDGDSAIDERALAAAVDNQAPDGNLHVWNVQTSQPCFPPVALPSTPLSVAFSFDDTRLAVLCCGGQVVVVAPLEGRPLLQFSPEDSRLASFRSAAIEFSPGGQNLVINTGRSVYVCDAAGKSRFPPIRPVRSGSKIINFAISGDGRHVATEELGGGDSSLQVWDLATGKPAAAPLSQPDNLFQFCFSRDGRRIFTACRDGQARLWDWETGKLVCPPSDLLREFWTVALSPDGRWGLTPFGGRSKGGGVQAVEFITGKPLTPGLGGTTLPLSFLLSADGTSALMHSNSKGTLASVDLSDLTTANRMDVDDLCTLAELVSGQRLHEGELAGLTSEEWHARWREFRRRHPDYGPQLQR